MAEFGLFGEVKVNGFIEVHVGRVLLDLNVLCSSDASVCVLMLV